MGKVKQKVKTSLGSRNQKKERSENASIFNHAKKLLAKGLPSLSFFPHKNFHRFLQTEIVKTALMVIRKDCIIRHENAKSKRWDEGTREESLKGNWRKCGHVKICRQHGARQILIGLY